MFFLRIQNDAINKMLNIYNKQAKVEKTKEAKKAGKSDQLNISSSAREFQVAMEEVKKQTEIREQKVAEIKRQIESGTYKVDAKKIADKMMQDANVYTKF